VTFKINFDEILPLVKNSLAGQLNVAGNFPFYPNIPNMSDSYIMSLSLL